MCGRSAWSGGGTARHGGAGGPVRHRRARGTGSGAALHSLVIGRLRSEGFGLVVVAALFAGGDVGGGRLEMIAGGVEGGRAWPMDR
ncbi:hypothetical protein MILUP08_46655 [Micromonospora lupini str. Lupac 08]|uniref:Uncharacterized protein n=1 Tax=Micromonospora lupini str. Lupac 08 TaxID=1150864 RepID=I0LD58_9ACTN|nr:hypothetical protein MILUP08_46655 [Micromonospora lupini str. Lupac 08]